jgi:outer membrane protein
MKIIKKSKLIFVLSAVLMFSGINAFAEENMPVSQTVKGGVEETAIMSLDDCIKTALANNPTIQAAISNTDVYKSKIGQAWSDYFPEISLSTGYKRSNPVVSSSLPMRDEYTDSYTLGTVSLDQLIYDFGKTSTKVKVSKANYSSSESDLQTVINKGVYNVKEAYYYLLYVLQQEKVMENTVDQFNRHLKQAEAFYKIGTRPKIDVTIARCNVSSAKLNLIKAKNEIDIAYAKLNNAMGIPEKSNYSLKDKLDKKRYDISFETVIKFAYDVRPELKASKSRTEASESVVKLSKRAIVPDLKASTSYTVGGDDFIDDYGLGMGLKLELPVTNGYLVKKQVDEAKAIYKRSLDELEKAKQDVFLEVKQAFIKLNEARERLPVSELSLEQAKESYDLSSGRYKVGLGDPIELKDAEIVYQNARLEYYKSLLDYNVAVANLERAAGKSLDKVQNDRL